MDPSSRSIGFPHVIGHLHEMYGTEYDLSHVNYTRLYHGAVSRRFPATFARNRWTVAERDLPAVAEFFGIRATAAA